MLTKKQNLTKKLVKYTILLATLIVILWWVKLNQPYSIDTIKIMLNELMSWSQRNTLNKETVELPKQTISETKKLAEERVNQLSEILKDLKAKIEVLKKKPEPSKPEQLIQYLLENPAAAAVASLAIVSTMFLISYFTK